MELWSVHSCVQWWKNSKLRPRIARVIVENKVAPFPEHGAAWSVSLVQRIGDCFLTAASSRWCLWSCRYYLWGTHIYYGAYKSWLVYSLLPDHGSRTVYLFTYGTLESCVWLELQRLLKNASVPIVVASDLFLPPFTNMMMMVMMNGLIFMTWFLFNSLT